MSESQSLHPPAGISAKDFFESWLSQAFANAGRSVPSDAPLVRVTLSGAHGGDWLIRADDGGLLVMPTSGRNDAVGVWLRQPTADFHAALTPEPDLPQILPDGWSALDLLFLDDRDVALVGQIGGRIALEIAGRRRRRWLLDAAFGKEGISAGRPRATVQIDAATYDGLRAKTIAPMQAMLGGKVKVDGDKALAMKALMLVGARLTR